MCTYSRYYILAKLCCSAVMVLRTPSATRWQREAAITSCRSIARARYSFGHQMLGDADRQAHTKYVGSKQKCVNSKYYKFEMARLMGY